MAGRRKVDIIPVLVLQIDVDVNECGGIDMDDRPVGRQFHVILIDH